MKKSFDNTNNIACQSFKAAIYLAPILLCSVDAMAATLDLEGGAKAVIEPVVKVIDRYFMHGLFISGAAGFLLYKGDLRERSVAFGIGVVAGGLAMWFGKAVCSIA